MNTRVNIEKRRMEKAFEMAKSANSDKYDSYIQKIPAYILTNGIGNTILFIKKGDGAWKTIYKQFNKYFEDIGLLEKDEDLLEKLIKINDHETKLYTSELLALLNWLRRFSKK